MGVTSSGLRWPEPTDAVTAGAVAIRSLAEDVTGVYPGKAALTAAVQPAGAAPGALPVRYAAGQATITLAAGSTTLVVPPGGKPWTQIFFLSVRPAQAGTTPVANYYYVTSASGTLGTFWITGYLNNVILTNGAVNVQYFAIGQ